MHTGGQAIAAPCCHNELTRQQQEESDTCCMRLCCRTTPQPRTLHAVGSPVTAAVLLPKEQRATTKPSSAGSQSLAPRFSTAVAPVPTRPTAPPEDGTSVEVPAAGDGSRTVRAVCVLSHLGKILHARKHAAHKNAERNTAMHESRTCAHNTCGRPVSHCPAAHSADVAAASADKPDYSTHAGVYCCSLFVISTASAASYLAAAGCCLSCSPAAATCPQAAARALQSRWWPCCQQRSCAPPLASCAAHGWHHRGTYHQSCRHCR
jgi:hypothetical protein